MSSYKVTLITIFVSTLFLSGCANKQKTYFEDENRYIILGLDSELRGDFNSSYNYFNTLYNATNELDYQIKQINLLIKLNKLSIAKGQILNALKVDKDNITLKKLLITIYLQEQNFDKSLEVALELLKANKEVKNYELVSSIYLLQRKYEDSLNYLEGAYALEYDEKILDKIITTLYIYIGDKDKAISYLESHTRLYGCGEKLCNNLLAIYAEKQDINGLISVYKRMYKESGDKVYGKKIAELLIFKKDFVEVTKFLENSGIDDKLLLEIYKMQRDFEGAKKLTMKLYRETKNIDFLAQSAMFEYEGAKDKNDKKLLASVVKKLKEVVSILDNDVYQNYLGYLLIDHGIDIKEGIKLVKKALQKDKESAYYLDSLAWGYYKLKKYKKAYKIMKKVVDIVGLEDKEVKFHWEKIKSKYRK